MSAKITASRRAAFLRALAQTGNVSASAERVKVSRSWVRQHRARDAGFDAACVAALGAARQRLGAAGPDGRAEGALPTLPSEWARLDGVEMVVRGSNGRRVQVARARVKQWTPAVERRFLSALASTCNVKAACAAVGLTPASAYNHRQRSMDFFRAWAAAIEIGYQKIEALMLQTACASLAGEPFDADAPLPRMTVADAFQLLHMHRQQVRGLGKEPGLRRRVRDLDDVRAGIVKKLEAIERLRD